MFVLAWIYDKALWTQRSDGSTNDFMLSMSGPSSVGYFALYSWSEFKSANDDYSEFNSANDPLTSLGFCYYFFGDCCLYSIFYSFLS